MTNSCRIKIVSFLITCNEINLIYRSDSLVASDTAAQVVYELHHLFVFTLWFGYHTGHRLVVVQIYNCSVWWGCSIGLACLSRRWWDTAWAYYARKWLNRFELINRENTTRVHIVPVFILVCCFRCFGSCVGSAWFGFSHLRHALLLHLVQENSAVSINVHSRWVCLSHTSDKIRRFGCPTTIMRWSSFTASCCRMRPSILRVKDLTIWAFKFVTPARDRNWTRLCH